MAVPGSDHPIDITPNPRRVRVVVGGVIVAETTRALSLKEASYPSVQYVPRDDVQMDLFERSERHSHCPYKGDASYFTITAGGLVQRDAAWSYETPLPGVPQIAGHLAFYPNKVDAIEELN
jgi:uncharacterized protein (DUF427 family)